MTRPSNLHAALVDRLGRLVVGGSIGRDGALPREDELAERFSVSRTVIREVTKTLQALGLVTTGPRVGTRVQPMTAWRLLDPQVMDWVTDADMASGFERDLLELRAMIEPAAAGYAAERAGPSQIAAITAALAAMAAASVKAEHEAADFRFHEAILDAAGNMLLTQLKPILHAVLKASFRLSMHDHARARASVAVHARVTDAILARRPDEARGAMIDLLRIARDDIARGPAPAREHQTPDQSTRNDRGTLHARPGGEMGLTRA